MHTAGDRNFAAELLNAAAARMAGTFLTDDDGSTLTYGAFFDQVRRYAGVLVAAGAAPGDRVVVQVEKSPNAVALYVACLWAGTAHVPLNPTFTPDERAYFIDDARPSVVVVDPTQAAEPSWLTLAADGKGSVTNQMAEVEPLAHPVDRADSDLAAILYTSGTTGRPKGAALTHEGLRANAWSLHGAWHFSADDRLVHGLPIFHVHGLFVALHCAMLSAIPVRFHRRFDADAVIDDLADATVFMGVPTHYGRLCANERLTPEACASIRLFTCGSAPLSEAAFDDFTARSGHRICERYGMSETGITVSNPYDGERIAGSIGFALPGVEARIIDRDGHAVETGTVGVVAIRSRQVMREYWGRPEATEKAYTTDGWFITGDVGAMAIDGRITLQGRASDMIISGGENVYPREIELVLDELPGIIESVVIGVPDPDFGERVLAVLVCSGESVSAETIQPALDTSLARFKHPRRYEYVDELPRNAMGKVQKNQLRQRYG
ncbi:MAG: AMP-binding protein [Acidimicrobiales bacterium]|nr:AMP-binding protein [Acidimicrobiales bacterium]MDG1876089.1 AMP-binding protein [Acidimicrobiales bacterium]